MDCGFAIDLVAELMNVTTFFIPIWIILGIGMGIGLKTLIDDIRGK